MLFESMYVKKSDLLIFLFMSVKFDPFITAYLRKGKFSGMTRRDWTIFIGSLFSAMPTGHWPAIWESRWLSGGGNQ